MLIINELSVGAFLLATLYLIYLIITLCISFIFLHLPSINHKCTQPCYFPTTTQSWYSEAEEDLAFLNMEF
jgi:hypothetical protein